MCPLINTPHPGGVIISQPKTSFLGAVFDVDHDFEGPRASKAHLDTVNTNLSHQVRRPFIPRVAGCVPTLLHPEYKAEDGRIIGHALRFHHTPSPPPRAPTRKSKGMVRVRREVQAKRAADARAKTATNPFCKGLVRVVHRVCVLTLTWCLRRSVLTLKLWKC